MYKDTNSSIVELLEKENTFTIHQKNIRNRAIEIYKEKHTFMEQSFIQTINATTVQYGTEIVGPKILSLFTSNVNVSEMIEIFKQKISCWKPDNLKPI